MIFLTGDVHHISLKTRELPYIQPLSEAELSIRYVEIAAEYGLKATLFITGRTFAEEFGNLERLSEFDNLEIGGHTFDGFKPLWLHRGVKLLRGSYWRSYTHQLRDVRNTVEIIRQKKGIQIRSWRNHSYEYDRNTLKILKQNGIRVWSDVIDRSAQSPERVDEGMISLPVNIIHDHSNLIHGYRTEAWLKKVNSRHNKALRAVRGLLLGRRPNGQDEVGYSASKWLNIFIKDIERKVQSRSVAVMNLHPVCMYLLDDFKTFRKICSCLSRYSSFFAKEAVEIMNAKEEYLC